MIADFSIQTVRNLPIEDVVGMYIPLKKNKALSPFTDEKTPSFSVSPSKNIFKCFSSGKGGDGITFVMEYKKLSFIEAIEEIANNHNITLAYDEVSDEERETRKKEFERRQTINELLTWANAHFASENIPQKFVAFRRFKKETLNKFKIGYASNSKDDIYQSALKAGLDLKALTQAGLIRNNNDKYYDTFQQRVIFPIHDNLGRIVAFTGRLYPEPTEQEKITLKEKGNYIPPKYFNSPDTLWEKGKHLYGLHLATKAIQSKGLVYLVEGNTDVMRFHEHGIENVVAPCGTALTQDQINLIKRYTDKVCIVPDSDKAGIKALHRSAELMLQNEITVYVLIPEKGKDPDEYLKRKDKEKVQEWLNDQEDYLSDYCVRVGLKQAAIGPKEKTDAITNVGRLIELIEDKILRKSYYDAITSNWKDFKQYKLKKRAKDIELPEDFNKDRREEYYEFGFFEEKNAYYYDKDGVQKTICLFKMKYLYFVETDDIPVYVVKFTNTFGKSVIKALSADQLTLLSDFKKTVGRFKGRFIFEANEFYLNKINIKLRGGLRAAKEPTNMGYYPEKNFWIWANGIYADGKLHKPDNYGVVKMKYSIKSINDFLKLPGESVIEINNKDHMIDDAKSSADKIGKEKLQDLIDANLVFTLEYYYLPYAGKMGLNINDNDYSDQKRFKLFPNSEIDFERWSMLIVDVYHNNGILMQGYFLMSLFRDIIYENNNHYTPLLNMFGPPQQGKSTAARSLAKMFGARHGEEEGSNLNTDTSSGIMEYINKFKNSIIWINELSRNLKKEREVKIEMLKTLAGGSGRKTRQTRSYAANKEKNHNGAIISGQDSPSFDPGLHDRVIPLKFDGQHRNQEKFDELKKLENKGYCTQVTADLLQYRQLIESNYFLYAKATKRQLIEGLKEMISEGNLESMPDDRIILNIVSMAAPVKILMENTELPFAFSFDEFISLALENIKYKSQIKATTNEVAQFFSVLAGAEIREGEHWKIQKEKDGKIKLFIRLRQIMPFYRQAASRQQMSPYGEGDIKDMLLMHRACKNEDAANPKYTVGLRTAGVDFPKAKIRNTSAIVLDYNILRSEGIEISSSEGFVEDFIKEDDESFEKSINTLIMAKTQLNGHAKETVFNFLLDEELADGKPKAITDLLWLFNRVNNTNLSKETFKEYCMEFMQQVKIKKVNFKEGNLIIKNFT